jgi:hypothetical protein
MAARGILFLLVQIQEAHSTDWPIGREHEPTPQATLAERVARAQTFVNDTRPPASAFRVCVDTWDNTFDNVFQAWPDRFYCVDANGRVIASATYGDATIDQDCTDLIEQLLVLAPQ